MANAKINPDKGTSDGTVVRNGLSVSIREDQPARKVEEPTPEPKPVKVEEPGVLAVPPTAAARRQVTRQALQPKAKETEPVIAKPEPAAEKSDEVAKSEETPAV